jgi:hypothetical protein
LVASCPPLAVQLHFTGASTGGQRYKATIQSLYIGFRIFCVLDVKTYPAAELGVGLLAVAVGALSREERAGLQGLLNEELLGGNAGPAKNPVGPVGEDVVREGYTFGRGIIWHGEEWIHSKPETYVAVTRRLPWAQGLGRRSSTRPSGVRGCPAKAASTVYA